MNENIKCRTCLMLKELLIVNKSQKKDLLTDIYLKCAQKDVSLRQHAIPDPELMARYTQNTVFQNICLGMYSHKHSRLCLN